MPPTATSMAVTREYGRRKWNGDQDEKDQCCSNEFRGSVNQNHQEASLNFHGIEWARFEKRTHVYTS